MDTSEEHRWSLLRWAPRHHSGVLYYPGHEGEVWVDAIAEVVPVLVATGDFAPADMQYRMHREHLWNPQTGLYGEAFNVDEGTWVREAPTASANAKVALGMAEALRIGGEGTPSEMRARWLRDTHALLKAVETLDIEEQVRATLERARARLSEAEQR
uniref:CAZy families GH105 protein n=1 Tax=uncultured Micromonospora sp. TaxID=429168 RepID=A0A060C2Z2_9ACTN|nr:CAZy families GH105 protein [uncultured Micromonospora sp.]